MLQHSYEYGENNQYDETKFIGVYSSMEQAKQAIIRLQNITGFKDYPVDCFYIDEYRLDEDNWVEGFVTTEEIEQYQAENNICRGDEYKKSIYPDGNK